MELIAKIRPSEAWSYVLKDGENHPIVRVKGSGTTHYLYCDFCFTTECKHVKFVERVSNKA